jgi:peptidoglycan-associated lipoprotein
MNRIISLFVLIMLSSSALFFYSCSGTNRLGKAKKAYDIGEYSRAVNSLNKVYRREKNRYYKGEASYYMAESYRLTNQPRKAATAYGRAIRYEYANRDAKLQQARQLMKLAEYEEAYSLFDEYLKEVSGNQLAYNGLASARMALNPPAPTRHTIEAVRKLNSRNSDYAPYIAPDDPYQIYFSSMRSTGKKRRQVNRITGQGTSAIYSSIQDSRGEWQEASLFLNQEMDGSFEDGTISMTDDGKEAYFTRTRYEKSEAMAAEIWMVKSMGGRWAEPVEVDLGPDTVIYAHPAISPDGSTLYFVSDMKGSVGGKDIWKVDKVGDNWGTPVNMGLDINTAGDEMFPYIRDNGILYFSSDGLPGYGGLDIFMAEKLEEEGRWRVKNLGQPMNSPADDLGISFFRNREAGYFSSSRGNARGYESIYSFALPLIQPIASGTIQLDNNAAIPHNTTVRVVGTDGTNTKVNVDAAGTFNLMLKPDAEYTMLVAVPGYLNHHELINTKGLTESKQYTLNITLVSYSTPITFNNIHFNEGSAILKPEANAELEKVLRLLNDNPTIEVEISAHTDAGMDEEVAKDLSRQRALEVYNFLTRQGIDAGRLSTRGAAYTQPLKVSGELAKKYSFLRENELLTEQYIMRLNRADQGTARQLNNRVELTIVR